MPRIDLKYGLNPHQKPASIEGDPMPLEVVNGDPSFINILDALRGWQLARELRQSLDLPAAASMKHISPAGAAVSGPIEDEFLRAHFYDADAANLSPVAAAYAKARSSDRQASFGDFVAVSERVDVSLAQLLKAEVSDGIIAPGYDDAALELLRSKKGGGYVILTMDADYEPDEADTRTEFGLTLRQPRNTARINRSLLSDIVTRLTDLPDDAAQTLLVTLITLKHTQSNSVCVGWRGQAVGVGAGQQSRIACTRLACDKADRFFLKQHPDTLALRFRDGVSRPERVNAVDAVVRWHELNEAERDAVRAVVEGEPGGIDERSRLSFLNEIDGVGIGSDAFFPFADNLDRAARSGCCYVAQPGGSVRDADVTAAADRYGMVMAHTGLRLFLH